MRFKARQYRCSACAFRCPDPNQDTNFPERIGLELVYDLGNGKYCPILKEEAFCSNCNRVVHAESLPPPEKVAVYIEGLDSPRRDQYQLPEELKVSFKTSGSEWRNWADENKDRRKRCLTCATPVVELLEAKGKYSDVHSEDFYRKYDHPGCEGTLSIFESPMYFEIEDQSETSVIPYSSDGRLIQGPTFDLAIMGSTETSKTVEVYVLDAKGDYTTNWEIGVQIPLDIYTKAYDTKTECIYAITTYENGLPRIFVTTRERWLQAKASIRRVDPGDA